MGDSTALGPYVIVYGEGGVTLGRFCGIATHTTIVAVNHKFDRRDLFIRLQGHTALGIRIGQ